MLSRNSRLELISALAQRVRNAKEDRLRHSLIGRFGHSGLTAQDLERMSRAVEFLESLDNSALLALRRELGIDFDPLAEHRKKRPRLWQETDERRIFLSYKSEHEEIAGHLSTSLGEFGLSAFVARYHIPAGVGWRDEVVRALFTMEAFVSIHTRGFSSAQWPMQEMGIAFGRQVPMIALAIDEPPGGIMQEVQALKVQIDRGARQAASELSSLLISALRDQA